ncbi:MAG TPA: holo-ACP synthase [Thermoanaerobacterales bacterium]|nr:holo-ACP synthase [Thermoanaerobacterales bacterium]
MEIGVDIVEINRIKKACHRKSFENRFFTLRELEGIRGKKNYYTHLAGKYAAKEAVVKAIGTGFRNMKWKDVEILNQSSGKPIAVLSGKARGIFESKNFGNILVTISHSKEYAIAFAVALGGAMDESSQSLNYEGYGSNRH